MGIRVGGDGGGQQPVYTPTWMFIMVIVAAFLAGAGAILVLLGE